MIICVHDVLQAKVFSDNQQKAIAIRPMFEWFKLAAEAFPGKRIKLACIANGVELYPEWVNMIKVNGWEVQCHGLMHIDMQRQDEEESFIQLKEAKQLLEDTFNQRITQFYPPRLKVSDHLYHACLRLGMTLVVKGDSIDNYKNNNLSVPEVYMHYWSQKHIDLCRQLDAGLTK